MEEKEREQAKTKGLDVHEIQVAIDGLTVAVNPANPVSKLTIDQLSSIFTGKVTDWARVGGTPGKIVVLSREKNSGTHVFFLEHVLRKGHAKGPEEYAPDVLMMPSSQALADEVARNANAIGYFGMGYFKPGRHKAIAVGKTSAGPFIMPSVESAATGRYPIARPLYFYTPKAPADAVKAFIDFVLSPDGQKIVAENEFVPLKAAAGARPVGNGS